MRDEKKHFIFRQLFLKNHNYSLLFFRAIPKSLVDDHQSDVAAKMQCFNFASKLEWIL